LPVPLTREAFLFNQQSVVPALEKLTGQSFGYEINTWEEWLGRQPDKIVPEGFTEWKADLLSLLDPRFGGYFVDPETGQPYSGEKVRLDITQVVWGGVLKDDGTGVRSIPALVNPSMITAAQAFYLVGDDRVFGISINGDSRAYPLRILNWHELANDVVGGKPVALAYCTLCGSGILYDATVDGVVHIFRTSGLLYKSNKLMYDVGTNTLWNQFTGEPAIGELADSGIKLKRIPITLTTWAEWRSIHPDTTVLSIETGYPRNYAREGNPGAAYNDYFADPETYFPVPERDDRLETKAEIYGLEIDGTARAYSIDKLKETPVTNDTLGDVNIVLITDPSSGAVRAYERGELSFQSGGDGSGAHLVLDNRGEAWQIEEPALVNRRDPNKQLERISGHVSFWFAWYTFHPDTTLFEGGN
ncbi:MAG: DUF3179 domain-containing protein, partial [Dehalococcoidia bacterium]